MHTETAVTVYRQDYQPYPFEIPHITLIFDLDPHVTTVTAQFTLCRRSGLLPTPLVLDGDELELVSVSVDGHILNSDDYQLNASTLTLGSFAPETATIQIVSRCHPNINSQLSGLYMSGENFLTQCEAQGYRRMTWFPDRPDVLSCYRVILRASHHYPVLLSNGNLRGQNTLADGRHEAIWEDPFPKPCCLFALVAGNFTHREMQIRTASGRESLLQIYSDPGAESKTQWALESLVRALRWDETRFGRELDLDRYMLVAARDFNMGAMENKGLNIFNDNYLLADPQTAVDSDYASIEAVVGHEYFHNWTGNRVSCRDWFQLSLKEGLTVFREQEFSADMRAAGLQASAAASARAVKRIDDVVTLCATQFPEDAGPMAHPIRPESYQEIGNFYTTTVYEKGAEVIRMQHTLLGEAGFRTAMDEYFRRYDGHAIRCDDFVDTMESVYQKQSKRDLSIFRRWYQQAGTPRVTVELEYDAQARCCTLTLSQRCALVGVEKIASPPLEKKPFHIPFAMGLLDRAGNPIMLEFAEGQVGAPVETALLELTTERQQWCFKNISGAPIPSLLRGFSAPVIVEYPWSDEALALLAQHDTDLFARWQACQEWASREILRIVSQQQTGTPLSVRAEFLALWSSLSQTQNLAPAYQARLLTLPAEKVLAERMRELDPPSLAIARNFLCVELGRTLQDAWQAIFEANHTPGPYQPTPEVMGQRTLKNLALRYITAGGDAHTTALTQYKTADNMTDRLAALSCLVSHGDPEWATQALSVFYEQWQHDPRLIDTWFKLQATAPTTTAATVRGLMAHPAFTLRNPNRARALVFQFCLNHACGLHASDGAGYDYWVEQLLALDRFNPEVAARLARAMDDWARCLPALRAPMYRALKRVSAQTSLSGPVKEIISKAMTLATPSEPLAC